MLAPLQVLVIIDAHSKRLIMETLPAATSQVTIQKPHSAFANHDISEMMEGAVFTSAKFKEFTKKNGM